MKRPTFILMAGLIGGLATFAGAYYLGTAPARALLAEPQPELAWLQHEFHLSNADLARIATLHQAYLPKCAERCRRIAEENEKLEALLAQATAVTPEIQAVMSRRAQMRADCETEMLAHFLEVSRTMPPEQGRRYLAWCRQQAFMGGDAMEQQHRSDSAHH